MTTLKTVLDAVRQFVLASTSWVADWETKFQALHAPASKLFDALRKRHCCRVFLQSIAIRVCALPSGNDDIASQIFSMQSSVWEGCGHFHDKSFCLLILVSIIWFPFKKHFDLSYLL